MTRVSKGQKKQCRKSGSIYQTRIKRGKKKGEMEAKNLVDLPKRFEIMRKSG